MDYMEKWRELLAASMLYRSNFKMLHWTATSPQFDRVHNTAEEYSDLMLEIEDEVAERLGRLKEAVFVSYTDAVGILEKSETNHLMIGSQESYNKAEFFYKSVSEMLTNLMNCIQSILLDEESSKPENVGLKSYLESLYDKLDKEARYLNPRRAVISNKE